MKKFIMLFLTAAATEAGATAPVVEAPAPTSEKLTEIDARIDGLYADLTANIADRTKAQEINMAIFKATQERTAELAAIKKHEADLKLQELRNQRVALVDELLAAWDANTAIQADKKASVEDKNAVYEAFKTKKEAVTNELLAKYPATKTATVAATGDKPAAGTKGGVSEAIKAILVAELATGKLLKDAKKVAEDAGHSRGTVGAVATQMVKDGEATN